VLAPETWLFWRRSDVVLPLRASPLLLANPRERLVEHVVARLEPDETVGSDRIYTPVLTNRLVRTGGADATDTVIIDELRSALFRDLQPKFRLVLTIAVLVFVLASVNVIIGASSAALEHQKETALRLAIGAAPRRLALEAGSQAIIHRRHGVTAGSHRLRIVPPCRPHGPSAARGCSVVGRRGLTSGHVGRRRCAASLAGVGFPDPLRWPATCDTQRYEWSSFRGGAPAVWPGTPQIVALADARLTVACFVGCAEALRHAVSRGDASAPWKLAADTQALLLQSRARFDVFRRAVTVTGEAGG